MMVREDNSEEITKNIEGNLKEDAESSASKEEEIPQEEEDNLNESSGEDEEMYSWDELKYKANTFALSVMKILKTGANSICCSK